MVALDGPVRDQDVGAYVRARRKANRLTQQQLAELAGVGLRFVKDLEHGKPTVQMASVDAVLAVFGKQLGVVDRPRRIPASTGDSPCGPPVVTSRRAATPQITVRSYDDLARRRS